MYDFDGLNDRIGTADMLAVGSRFAGADGK
jgi:hypothetical protein